MLDHNDPSRDVDPRRQPRGEQPPKIEFEALAHGAKEVLIQHAGQLYRLRLTKNGKLILNK